MEINRTFVRLFGAAGSQPNHITTHRVEKQPSRSTYETVMKTKLRPLFIVAAMLALQPSNAHAQGTAFTYQGRLNSGGSAANGSYDLTFALFNAGTGGSQVGGSVTNLAVGVTNGLFTTTLDFGGVFTGNATWLAIGVRTNNSANTLAFAPLTPLQALTPTPYAILAGTAGSATTASTAGSVPASGISAGNASISITGNAATATSAAYAGSAAMAYNALTATTATTAANVTGNISDAQLPANVARLNGTNNFTGTNSFAGVVIATNVNNVIAGVFIGNGGGLTNLNTALFANSVLTNGESGLTLGGNFSGNGANMANVNAAQLNGLNATNFWQTGGNAGTVAGTNFIGTTDNQPVELWVNGSRALRLEPTANDVVDSNIVNVIGGSSANYLAPGIVGATIGGGGAGFYHGLPSTNSISARFGTIGGGLGNTVQTNAYYSTIGGGNGNTIQTNAFDSVIGGGLGNAIQPNAAYAAIPGGYNNIAGGTNSFAAGYRAQATNNGAFVWSDGSTNRNFNSTADNQFSVRANGGVRFVTGGGGMTVDGQPVLTQLPGAVVTNTQTGVTLGGTFSGTLTGNADTATTANNFSGSLSGDVTGTQGATVVVNVGGQSAANIAAGASAANAATSAATISTIVKRDTSGNFSAGSITLGGSLTLPAMEIFYAANSTLLRADGNLNFFAGIGAGNLTTIGNGNTAVGSGALRTNTVGNGNTALGLWTLTYNTNGSYNTAAGDGALYDNTSGNYNLALGWGALGNSTTGSNNIALGSLSGVNLAPGNNNNIDLGNQGAWNDNGIIRIGTTGNQTAAYVAGTIYGDGGGLTNLNAGTVTSITAGAGLSGGTITGSGTLSIATGGVANNMLANNSIMISPGTGMSGGGTVALGGTTTLNNAGVLSVTGNADITASAVNGAVTLGDTASSANTVSTIVKRDAGGNFSAGSINVGGSLTLPTPATVVDIIYSGSSTLLIADNNQNFYSGFGAGNLMMNGYENTANGAYALNSNMNGSYNTANGYQALYANTNGYENAASGNQALYHNTSGYGNTANGYQALWFNTSGSFNIALGYRAGYNLTTGTNNIDIGNQGVATDTNIIRIGSGQTSAFINAASLTVSGTVSATNTIYADSGAQNTGALNPGLIFGGISSSEGIASKRTSGTDQYGLDFYTQNAIRMTVNNNGQVGIGTTTPGYLLVVGNSGSPAYCNGTTWVNGSDRNAKENFAAISPRAVLEKISTLPITEWKYKVEADGSKHIGPMAQDFHAAFGLNGVDDKHIATVDEEGVALAAIQGLNEKLETGSQNSEARMEKLEMENAVLKQSVAELKAMVEKLAGK